MLFQQPNDQVEAPYIMRALDPEVKDAIWAAFEARLPHRAERHPLGCHRPRSSDRDCFELIVVRLATGCSWEDAERLTANKVSDTTARARRRDEWIAAGIFDALSEEALCGFDKVIGLDLSEVAVDGSLQKSPCGGEGTGKNPPPDPAYLCHGNASHGSGRDRPATAIGAFEDHHHDDLPPPGRRRHRKRRAESLR